MGLTISSIPLKKSNLHLPKKKKSSTDAAMALLEYTRQKQLKIARDIAWQLTEHGKTVTSRDVVAVMVTQGLYEKDIPAVWLGALFKTPEWEWTGKYAQYAVPRTAKRTHAWRTVMVWRRRA
jgi:histone H3/H4